MIKILDGAMGSELIKKGELLPNHIWSADSNIKNPELVYQIHQNYVDAGSTYITTNTFRTTPRAYQKTGLSESDSIEIARESLRMAARMAKKARNDKVKVLGSIAPLEDCYKPELFPGEDIAKTEFNQTGKWLVEEGADIFLIETMNSISETKACLESILEFNLPVWVSFVLKNSEELLSREKLIDAILMIGDYDVDCFLLNCNPLDKTSKAMEIVSENWKGEWGIYPNLGIGEPSPDGIISDIHSDKEFLSIIDRAKELGTSILGGCCGSDINHIKLIANHTL